MCVLPLEAAVNVRFCVTLHVRIAQHKQKKRGGNDDETWLCGNEMFNNSHSLICDGTYIKKIRNVIRKRK